MAYFAGGTSPLEEALGRLRASTEQSLDQLDDARSRIAARGVSPEAVPGPDTAAVRATLADSDVRRLREEQERQATLDRIRRQAAEDAAAAWDREDRYYAPVLFQPLARTDGDWEAALTEISQVGWRLDSWHVIGPAPEPFGQTVTLIQTLFVR